jgi:hypothetical protein
MANGRRRVTLLKGLLVLGLVAAGLALSVQTVLPQSEADTATAVGAVLTGEYCIECHLSGDERIESALDWEGGVYRQQSIPCDPVRIVREEDYHAGNLMLKIAQAGEDFTGDRVGAEHLLERLDPQRDNLDKLAQAEVQSVGSFTGDAKGTRFQAGKLLPEALDMHDETRRRTVILAIVFGSIFLAFLGVLGWERTLKK